MDIQPPLMIQPNVAIAAHKALVVRNPNFEAQAAQLRQMQIATYRQTHLGQNLDIQI